MKPFLWLVLNENFEKPYKYTQVSCFNHWNLPFNLPEVLGMQKTMNSVVPYQGIVNAAIVCSQLQAVKC